MSMDHQAVTGGSPETSSSCGSHATEQVHRSNYTFTQLLVPLHLASSFESSGFIEQGL